MKTTFLFFSLILLVSCIKEESPVTPLDRGQLESGYMEQSIYDYSGFYNLQDNRFISYVPKGEWDIAFDCNENYILLNGSRPVKAAFVASKDFDFVNEKNEPDSLFIDNPNGDLTKSALGQWWVDETGNEIKLSKVCYINRGRDERRRPLGVYKFQVIDWDDNSYTIRFGESDENTSKTITIQKNPLYNFVYLNFDKPEEEIIFEPLKEDWDLLFKEESEYVPLNAIGASEEVEAIPYQVRGVYLNPFNVEAVEFENKDSIDFTDITRDDVASLELSKHLNVIGYDWKNFSLQGEVYAVNPKRIYIIKDTKGFLYKLRFISFFSKTEGVRGYTSFEIQQL